MRFLFVFFRCDVLVVLAGIVLDDLWDFANDGDFGAAGGVEEGGAEAVFVGGDVVGGGGVFGGLDDDIHAAAFVAHADFVVGFELVGGDVDAASVDEEVAVGDELTRPVDGGGKAGA